MFNETYFLSNQKFIAKLCGGKGGDEEGELDNRRAFTKGADVFHRQKCIHRRNTKHSYLREENEDYDEYDDEEEDQEGTVEDA